MIHHIIIIIKSYAHSPLTKLFGPCLQPYKISIDFPEEDAHKTSMESNVTTV